MVSRATEIHARTLELFDVLGVADEFVAEGHVLGAVQFIARGRPVARLSLRDVDSDFPAKLALPQAVTERILGERLARHGVTVERGAALRGLAPEPDGITAHLATGSGTTAVRAQWVVGSDGFHSAVRRLLGIPFEGTDYPGLWGALDAQVDGWTYPLDEIPVFLDGDGFWAMPLPGGWHRLYFRRNGGEEGPTADEAQAVLTRHDVEGRVLGVRSAGTYRIHFRTAERFSKGRVFLTGDAAHVCSPVLGEGMNTGIQDACNLAWKLALVTGRRAPVGLADSYDTERRAVDRAAGAASDEGQSGTTLTDPAAMHARDLGMAVQFATPAAQAVVTEAQVDLLTNYRHSPIVGSHRARERDGAHRPAWSGPSPGDRVPDAGPLVRSDGTSIRLRSLMRPARHVLLVLVGEADDDAVGRCAGMVGRIVEPWRDLVESHVVVVRDQAPARIGICEVVADPELAVHARLGAADDTLYLVRPDAYLAFRSEPPDERAFHRYAQRVFLR